MPIRTPTTLSVDAIERANATYRLMLSMSEPAADDAFAAMLATITTPNRDLRETVAQAVQDSQGRLAFGQLIDSLGVGQAQLVSCRMVYPVLSRDASPSNVQGYQRAIKQLVGPGLRTHDRGALFEPQSATTLMLQLILQLRQRGRKFVIRSHDDDRIILDVDLHKNETFSFIYLCDPIETSTTPMA